jgi:hypothetical protein
MAEFSVVDRSITTIARFLALVRALVYDILRFCWFSPQPHEPAAFHAFDVFIAIAHDAVLSWTRENGTRAVVKFVPLVFAVSIFVYVNLHSSPLPLSTSLPKTCEQIDEQTRNRTPKNTVEYRITTFT